MHTFGWRNPTSMPTPRPPERRALDLVPIDGWAVHAVTHVIEMQGRIDEGIGWLTSREADWATPDNAFAPHNCVDLALPHMESWHVRRGVGPVSAQIVGPQADIGAGTDRLQASLCAPAAGGR